MTTIHLADYQIQVGQIWPVLQSFLNEGEYARILILVDENTRKYCLPLVLENVRISTPEIIEIPAGELHKNIETCSRIWQQMMAASVTRKSLLLNLGGGVIGDMGGFCASTFKRGIDFIQIPTTLLSQVDASIGGKLGIDFAGVKNSIGLFVNPKAVLIEPAFLKTLPTRELRSGFAEVLKHSLIADKNQWLAQKQFKDLSQVDWEYYLPLSIQVKKNIVEDDPFEKNIRKALNFGHTIGHAVESIALESAQPLLHGEAIAIGMVAEAYLSWKCGGLSRQEFEEIKACLLTVFGHPPLDTRDFDRFLQVMKNDKKNESEEINFTLLPKIGSALVNQSCNKPLILESLRAYNQA